VSTRKRRPRARRPRRPTLDPAALLGTLLGTLVRPPEPASASSAGLYTRNATSCPQCHAALDVAVRLKLAGSWTPLGPGAATRCPSCHRALRFERDPEGQLRLAPALALTDSGEDAAWLRLSSSSK
jgi:hypothetical protein